MSNQGTASNKNGTELQDEVVEMLIRGNIKFEKQKRTYPGLNPAGHTHDIIATINGKDTVVECKSFSGQAGTIWQKLPYAIMVLESHGVPGLLVLGGEVPTDWRRGFLIGLGARHNIRVWTVGQLQEYIDATNRG